MRNKLFFVSMILTTAFCINAQAQKAPPSYHEVQQFIKEQNASIAQKQKENAAASEKVQAVIEKSKADQQTNIQALQQNQQAMAALSAQPSKPEKTSGPIPTCATSCDDTSNAYNYKGNFLFDAQGKKTQRIYPSPCQCPQATNGAATTQSPSPTTPTTTKQKNNWNIQY